MSQDKELDDAAVLFKHDNESILTDERGRYLPGAPIVCFKAGASYMAERTFQRVIEELHKNKIAGGSNHDFANYLYTPEVRERILK